MEPIFFRSGAEFRRWLEGNHDSESEVLIGFYRKASGRSGISYQEALDQALCYGWIDGIRRRIDDERYTTRFTPRRPRSVWSAVNIRRVGELTELGLMHPAGLAAFARRDPNAPAPYSSESPEVTLDEPFVRRFRRNRKAWEFFQGQPPGYRRTATWWVVSAKREDTRRRRLEQLVSDSAKGRRIPPLTPPDRRNRD